MAVARLIAPLLILTLSACVSSVQHPSPQPTTPVNVEPRVEPPVAAPETEQQAPQQRPSIDTGAPRNAQAGVAQRLLEQADQELSRGNYQLAIETAERGLRMDRYAAGLYRVLAESYLALGSRDLALNFTRMGLRYVGADGVLEAQLLGLAQQLRAVQD